jgi:hypothetical protein
MRDVSLEELADNINNPSFGDDLLGVVFYNRTVEDATKSAEVGHRVFKTRDYVKIMIPGDRHNMIDRPVQRTGTLPTDDIMRFPKQWQRYQNKQEQQEHEGTPLMLWNVMPAPLAEELKHLNIFTVEQLANLADIHAQKIRGGPTWKQKASEFMKALKDTALVGRLQVELAERDNTIETQGKAIRDQADKIERMSMRLAKLEK